MNNQKIKEDIVAFFKELEWPSMNIQEDSIEIPMGKILQVTKETMSLNFFSYSRTENQYYTKNRPTLVCALDFDLLAILRLMYKTNYDIKYYDYIKDILSITDEYKQLVILKDAKELKKQTNKGIYNVPQNIFLDLIKDSEVVYKKGKSSKDRLERYLKNKLKLKYTGKRPKEVTTVAKGDFSFLIDRFNLKNVKRKKHLLGYLNEQDIFSLEDFTKRMISDRIFSEAYLKKLDDYFIKEKLTDIINLGQQILQLRKIDLKTKKAQAVIVKLKAKKIKQMENIWQKYFEENLLYLIFSYKKIYPKIELEDVSGDKKYPDFIGINHYNGLDIIEIKTHLTKILVWDSSHKNFSFSPEMSKAVIQTMNYLDAIVQRRFKNQDDDTNITGSTDEENLYHPRGIIVISSLNNLTNKKMNKKQETVLNRDFTKLRNSLKNIEIITFDEVLKIASDYIANILDETPIT